MPQDPSSSLELTLRGETPPRPPRRLLQALRELPSRVPDTRRPYLVLSLLCALLWLPGFFTLPPGDRDESRFAQATRQMLDSGDPVRIRYLDEDRNKKPVGIHWAQAVAVVSVEALHLGDRSQIWPYRIPSLLGGLAAVLATFGFGRTLVGRRAAFVGAALLASSVILVAETHIAKTDAALLGTVAVAMGLFGRAYLHPESVRARHAVAFWAVLGASILLKGPIGPLVPLLCGITLAVADRLWARDGAVPGTTRARLTWWRSLRPGWGVPLMLAVAAPWFVAIGIATRGRFFTDAVGGDLLSKLGNGMESHWGPPGYYLLAFALTGFPGAWIAARAAVPSWAARAQPPVRFLLAWAVPTWLMFEAAATKLPHYALPAYPAVMLLAARWAMDPLRRPAPRWLAVIATAGFVVAGLALTLSGNVLPGRLDRAGIGLGLATIPLGALLLWVVLRGVRRGRWGNLAMAGVLLAIPLYFAVLELTLPRLQAPWLAPRLATLIENRLGAVPADRIGLVGIHEPSLVFTLGTATHLLDGAGQGLEFLAGGPDRLVVVTDRELPAFLRTAAARHLATREVGMLAGMNYSRGRQVALILYRLG